MDKCVTIAPLYSPDMQSSPQSPAVTQPSVVAPTPTPGHDGKDAQEEVDDRVRRSVKRVQYFASSDEEADEEVVKPNPGAGNPQSTYVLTAGRVRKEEATSTCCRIGQ